jgi:hypothetical protein
MWPTRFNSICIQEDLFNEEHCGCWSHHKKSCHICNQLGAITIKQAKKHVGQPQKLYKNYNFVRYIFVVPL